VANTHKINVVLSLVGEQEVDLHAVIGQGSTKLVTGDTKTTTVVWWQFPTQHSHFHVLFRFLLFIPF
jgi:hypothetical protein